MKQGVHERFPYWKAAMLFLSSSPLFAVPVAELLTFAKERDGCLFSECALLDGARSAAMGLEVERLIETILAMRERERFMSRLRPPSRESAPLEK